MHDSKDGEGRATQEAKAEEQLPNGDRAVNLWVPVLGFGLLLTLKRCEYARVEITDPK